MRRVWIDLTCAASIAVFAAACSGDSGSAGPSFSDSVSTADAQNFAGDAVDGVVQAVDQLNFGEGALGLSAPSFVQRMSALRPLALRSLGGSFQLTPRPLPDWRAALAMAHGPQLSAGEGCTVTERGFYYEGGFVDVDQDGFPDDLYEKIECSQTDSTSNADTTYVQTMLIEEHVKQNFASLHGYDISITLLEKIADEFGNFESGGESGTESLDIRSGSASHKISYKSLEASKFDTASANWEAGASENVDFTPSAAIVLGDPLPSGSLNLSGREYVTDTQDQNLSFSLSTSTPLAYDASCYSANSNPPFTAGVLIGLLNNNASSASFSATFTACGSAPTVTTNGTHDPSVVAARK